ncbi:MAG TPA: hypothetical protein VMR44_05820 [Thermoanaerobaculia bacterium]|nr:hypothetical protein [Thermoanaerobaculia bacterium]
MKARRQRCSALISDRSRRCQRWASKGQQVCQVHGGGSPQAKRSASQRLAAMVDPALVNLEAALLKAAERGAELSTPALRAAAMILDRAGFPPGVVVEVEDRRESTAWIRHATLAEHRELIRIMERCQARMAGEHEAGNGTDRKKVSKPTPKTLSKAEPEVMLL